VTEYVTELTNAEAEALDLALQRAFDNIARDPTVAAYLERFPIEDRERALRDRIFEKLVLRNLEDWPARLGRLSGGVFFGNEPTP
jgi:hypothetical protein